MTHFTMTVRPQAPSPDAIAVHGYLTSVVLHPKAGPLKFTAAQSNRVIEAFTAAGFPPAE